MALLTKSQVLTNQYSLRGSPWSRVAAKSGINLDTLEYTLVGAPWYGVEEASSGGIKKFASITWASVKKVSSVSEASIKKISGITN